jgi:cytochrome oxidase Cu insertion factor (SCO1/SenC/PrrC family)
MTVLKILGISLVLPLLTVSFGDKIEIGSVVPDFSLNDLNGKVVKLSDFKGKIVVLEWTNPNCPFV